MKRLLATIGLFLLLTSPASADHVILQHGESYTDEIISCASKTDSIGFIHSLKSATLAVGSLTVENVEAAAQNNNCIFQTQHFVYLKENYVCEFDIIYSSFTLLNTEVEGIKQYIIVYSITLLDDNVRPLQCIQD